MSRNVPASAVPAPDDCSIAELRRQVDELRAELGSLRDQLATKARTKRIVVIDENVQELIYSEVNSYGASLNVRWGTDADGVRVSMQADNEMSEDGYEGHLLVTAGGEIAAWMRAGIEYEDGEYKRDGVVWLQEDEGKRGCVSARRAQHMKVAPKEIRTSNSPTADGGGRVRFE